MVATAESCTGGLVAGALTEIAGSSAVVDRGFVTYTNEAKHADARRAADTLNRFGAVSRETAEAMARGALGHANADLAVVDHRHRRAGRRLGGQAGRARAFRRRLARAASSIHRERRFGDIGRAEVRRLSVLEALAMLTELAGEGLGGLAPVNLVGARLEGRGEAAEGDVEHRRPSACRACGCETRSR